MLTDSLFQALSRIHTLPKDFRDALDKEVRHVAYPKNHLLVQAHSFAYHAYFLEKGFAVSYQYRGNKKVVTAFWQPGDFVFVPKSFFEQTSSEEIIQLTIDSELHYVTFPIANMLFEHYPVANLFARSIVAQFHTNSVSRIADLHYRDPWQRYSKLVESYPGIELHASQDLIASYLNITPQSLSRLKHRHKQS